MQLHTRWISTRVAAALPMLLSAGTAAWIVWYWHLPQINMPLVLGIIAGGLVDLDNRLTGRIKNIVITLAAFAAASLAVEWSFGEPWRFAAVLTGLTFCFTFIGIVGLRYRTIAFGTIVVALYTAMTHSETSHWYANPLLIVCGTLLYSLYTLLTHLAFSHRPVQECTAAAYRALAAYLDAKSAFFDPDGTDCLERQQIRFAMQNAQVTTAFNQVRNALFYRLRGQHRHPRTARMLHFYFAAQDIHERISSSHVEYGSFADSLRHSDLIFRIQRLLEWQAQSCRDVAHSLRHDMPLPDTGRLNRQLDGLRQSLQHHRTRNGIAANDGLDRLLDNLAGVNYQLNHLGDAAVDAEYSDDSDRNRIAAPDLRGWHAIHRNLRAHLNLQSAVFRHAVRLSLLVIVCIILIEALGLPFGYWLPLTAVFICQPNYSATKTRLQQRVIGTVAGVLAGSLLPYFTPSLETKLAVVVAGCTLFFFFRTNKYSYSNFFITLQAVVSFSIAGIDVAQALPQRLLDTVVGAAVAWAAVSFIWPDWHYTSLRQTAQRALGGSAGYLNAIIGQISRHCISDDVGYRTARRLAHEHAAQLSSTLSDMSGEPKKYAAQLENGFTLLKTNYALISYISALGAYRSDLAGHIGTDGFLDDFVRTAAQTAALIDTLDRLPPADFEHAAAAIAAAMQTLRPDNEGNGGDRLLWYQLDRICRLLPPLYYALQTAAAAEEHAAAQTA